MLNKVEVALFFLILSLIPFYSFTSIDIKGKALDPSWIFAVILLFLFFAELTTKKKKLFLNKIGLAIVALNITAVFSLVGLLTYYSANSIADFLTTYVQILLALLFYLAATNLDIQWQQIFRLFKVWILIALLIAIYGIYQFPALAFCLPFAKFGWSRTGAVFGAYGLARSTSIFPEPLALGGYLLGPILLLLMALLRQNEQLVFFKTRTTNWLVFFTLFTAFILTFSLGAFAALLGTALVFLLKWRGRLLRRGLKCMLSILMVLVVANYLIKMLYGIDGIRLITMRLYVLIHQMLASIGIGAEGSVAGPGTSYFMRLDMIRAALSVWAEHPLFGVGLNNFGNVAPRFKSTVTPFQVLADQGILGLSAYFFFFWTLLKSLRIARTKLTKINAQKFCPSIQTLLLGLNYVVWALFFSFFFGGTWFTFNQLVYFTLIGLLVNKINRESSAINNIRKEDANTLSKGATQ